MKKIVFIFLLMGSAVLAQKQEKRQVIDFEQVKVSQGIHLDYTAGGSTTVAVEVDDEKDMQYVKTEVKNGVLQVYIDMPRGIFNYKMGRVHVKVNHSSLTAAHVSSSAVFTLNNKVKAKQFSITTSSSGKFMADVIQADNLTVTTSSSSKVEGKFEIANSTTIEASSSSKIDMDLKANKVELIVSSSARVEVEGSAKSVDAKASSSAKIDGKDFAIQTLNGKASSSGTMSFTVADEVKGKASSSGKINVYGNARLVETSKSSGGKIEKLN
ncbi:DUF2807 domain-containing protein [Myroides sp. DF42-4-2]|uniref:GIN domain-containing protein n=1 Tax=unclassified Myroides TaxID=2642485 RepID=UPI00257723B5|nr:DUF2807 domain-containing protein [Myroides sp. DF42-4-2]MDM1408794.1 DUF2807 domain-containing protein [Myroides sp. DF42-4-2]